MRSFRKRKISGSDPTVGKDFSLCNPSSTRDPHSSCKPMQMKAKYDGSLVLFISVRVNFNGD